MSESMWKFPDDKAAFVLDMTTSASLIFVEAAKAMKMHRDKKYPRNEQSPAKLVQWALLRALFQRAIMESTGIPDDLKGASIDMGEKLAAKINMIFGDPTVMPAVGVGVKPGEG